MANWAVAEAKAKFSELIETAREQGAQWEITRNGKLHVGAGVARGVEEARRYLARTPEPCLTFLGARRWRVRGSI